MSFRFFLIFVLLLIGINLLTINALFNIDSRLASQEIKLQNQLVKSNFMLESNNRVLERIANIHDVVNWEKGHNGVYDPQSKNVLLVTRERTLQEVCLTFLHEMGHVVDHRNGDLDIRTPSERELFANEYRDLYAWRCEGLE